MEDEVELDLEAINFDPVAGYQWLIPNLEGCQPSQGSGCPIFSRNYNRYTSLKWLIKL